MLLKAICRKSCTSLKTLLFQNKIEQRFCCSRLFLESCTSLKTYFFKIKLSSGFVAQGYFLEKVYRFLSGYEYEYASMRSANMFVEFQLEKVREVCVNIFVKAGV